MEVGDLVKHEYPNDDWEFEVGIVITIDAIDPDNPKRLATLQVLCEDGNVKPWIKQFTTVIQPVKKQS